MQYKVVSLPGGWAGTSRTVSEVMSLVEKSLTDPKVVETARNIVFDCTERDKDCEIDAISDYVRSHLHYVNEGIETLSTPRYMIDQIEKRGKFLGDCDDAVTLWLALHRALGHKVRVKVVSQRQDGLANHIYGEVYSPTRGWITDDTIVKNQPLGWSVPEYKITNSRTYEMSGMCCAECRNGMGCSSQIGDDMAPPASSAQATLPVPSGSAELETGHESVFGPRAGAESGVFRLSAKDVFTSPAREERVVKNIKRLPSFPKPRVFKVKPKPDFPKGAGGKVYGSEDDWMGRGEMWSTDVQTAASGWFEKTGGNLVVGPGGKVEGVGQVVEAALSVAKPLAKIGKKIFGFLKKHKGGGGGGPAPCPPGYHRGVEGDGEELGQTETCVPNPPNYLLYGGIAIAGLVALKFILPMLQRRR